ncbi:unnamed protein product [Withania somnifera]
MEEDSKNCEFWLPPQFLSDDDIFMGFKNNSNGDGTRSFRCDFQKEFSYGFNMFGPHSDLSSPVESVFGSSETESDEEDYITELTRQMAHTTLENHKGNRLSSSPQSTLRGVLGSKQRSSSESPNSPSQVGSPMQVQSRNGTVDLLYAAVGEVARMKKLEEEVGLCHHKNGIWAPTMKTSPVFVEPKMSKPNLGSFYNQPPLSYQQFSMAQLQRLKQQQIRKQRQGVLSQENDGLWQYQLSQNQQPRNGADRSLDMSMSAWPTLQQSHHHHQQPDSGMRAVVLGNPGPKRECAGTGVFIPRRVGTQTETRKKKPGCSTVFLPDRVVQALNLNLQHQVQPRCNNGGVLKYGHNDVADQRWRNLRSQPAAAMSQELQLPLEWTY